MTAEEMLDEMEVAIGRLLNKVENKLPSPNPEDLKKNSHLHIFMETPLHKKLKKEAQEKGISLSEVARRKLRGSDQLDRIEGKIDRLIFIQ